MKDKRMLIILIFIVAVGLFFGNLPVSAVSPGDADGNGNVNILDYQLLSASFGMVPSQSGYDARCDFNGDSQINILDYQILNTNFGMMVTTPTPTTFQGSVITLTGITNQTYENTVPNNTLIDASNWTNTAVGPPPSGSDSRSVEIFGTDNSSNGASNIIWQGGLITGSLPPSWDWRTAHDQGNSSLYIYNSGYAEWRFVRVHNVEDAIKPVETPEFSNTASFMLRDSYITAIRDDSIENDRFEPGIIQDSLFDGVHTFLSEQDQGVGSNNPLGPNETDTIFVKRVYVRLHGVNGPDGPGKWFKWQGSVPHHKVVVSDSILAVTSEPKSGWSSLDIPPEVSFSGSNNYILWLGTPGTYGGTKPQGTTYLEGTAAHGKWISVRNKWLTDHGLPAQSQPADYNPHDAPLQWIPQF